MPIKPHNVIPIRGNVVVPLLADPSTVEAGQTAFETHAAIENIATVLYEGLASTAKQFGAFVLRILSADHSQSQQSCPSPNARK